MAAGGQVYSPGAGPVPVSLLTGFLGSGKTTVLNHLVRQPELARTVIIVNEFGAVGIDHDLIERSDEDIVLLQSGCLCCTIRGDLSRTLRSLIARELDGEIPEIERVIIETTGLADPIPILHTLMTEPLIIARYRLDGVIATVDAVNGMDTLDRQMESVKQVAVADRILLTKTDLARPQMLDEARRRLTALNPGAPLIIVSHGAVAPDRLLDAGLYNPKKKKPDVERWLNAEAYAAAASHSHHHHHGHGDHGHDHHHHHDINRHDAHINAVCLTFEEPIPGEAFADWLEGLLMLRGANLLRMKGIVNVEGYDGPYILHGVQHILHPPFMMKRWPGKDRRTRLVFITRDIQEDALRDTLKMFINDALLARAELVTTAERQEITTVG